ncbi:hypothetical protein ACFX13_044214 [Malus domestica]
MRNLAEFRDVGVQGVTSVQPTDGTITSTLEIRVGHWQKPGFGVIKVNIDAAWCKETLCAGVGWIARDFVGLLQAVRGSGRLLCHSATAVRVTTI